MREVGGLGYNRKVSNHTTAAARAPGLPQSHGAWALVAGASEGLGAAFARSLARRGLNLVLIARRAEPLESLADELRRSASVEVRTIAQDLASDTLLETLPRLASELEIGVSVYNAAFAPVGEFVERSLAELEQVIDVNVRGPVRLVHALAPPMVARGRGAVILMSSLAGLQGSPRLSTYAATKAFNVVLAEGLWDELRRRGVDVLVCCAGAVRTPGYGNAATRDAPGTLDPEEVVERTLEAIGSGPRVTPGLINRIASLLVGRWLPRRLAVGIMANATRELS